MYTIMVVDDETEICDFVTSFFETRNFRVFAANDGAEALMLAESRLPHIILLDLLMPVMDGMGMLKRLWEKKIQSSVIMVTAVEDSSKISEAKQYGAVAYMTKPILLEELERNVSRIVSTIKP